MMNLGKYFISSPGEKNEPALTTLRRDYTRFSKIKSLREAPLTEVFFPTMHMAWQKVWMQRSNFSWTRERVFLPG